MNKYPDKTTKSKKTVIIVTVISVILLLCIAIFSVLAAKAGTDNIYSGVCIGSVELGGMDKEGAVNALADAYDTDEINVKVDCEGTTFDIYGASYGISIDYEASADKALSHGKEGLFLGKISNMLKIAKEKSALDLVLTCDYNALQYAINEKLGEKITDVQQHSVEFGENELVISNGGSGKTVTAQKLLNKISKAIVEGNLSETISVNIEDVEPDLIDIDKFLEEYNRDACDATVSQNGDEITITPEIIGVKIDKDSARVILEKNRNSTEVYTIPAEITYPEITAVQLEEEYTDTVIATYSTDYSTSSANRKTNIQLASSKINGLILNPGQVFSFNDIVGPRTEATGYKMAHVYSGSKVVDGIGGGICQVSSTLYNSVVLADLEIVYRTNHSMPVSYVPLGRDATVSYGTIDFKFKNNKETPIKLEAIADGNNLTINVYGRKKYIKDISIETAILGSVPFSTTTIEDDTMFEDETLVEEKGVNGTKVEAYKVIKENGVEVSRTLLAKSNYSPTTKVVRVGTQKRTDTQQPVVPGTQTPATTESQPESTLPSVYESGPAVTEPSVSDSSYTAPQTPAPETQIPQNPAVSDVVSPVETYTAPQTTAPVSGY